MMRAQLGMIPDWQFSADPGVNIKLNPHVKFPEGWTQSTIQPVGPAYAAPRIAQPSFAGLGLLPRTRTVACDQSCGCAPQNPCCCGESTMFSRLRSRFTASRSGVHGLGMPIARTLGFFDSWAFQNRKALVLGGLGLIAAAGFGLTAMVLK